MDSQFPGQDRHDFGPKMWRGDLKNQPETHLWSQVSTQKVIYENLAAINTLFTPYLASIVPWAFFGIIHGLLWEVKMIIVHAASWHVAALHIFVFFPHIFNSTTTDSIKNRWHDYSHQILNQHYLSYMQLILKANMYFIESSLILPCNPSKYNPLIHQYDTLRPLPGQWVPCGSFGRSGNAW